LLQVEIGKMHFLYILKGMQHPIGIRQLTVNPDDTGIQTH